MHVSRLVFDEKERVSSWVAEQVDQAASWGDCYAMGAEVKGELVGGIVFNNFNLSNATCHIAVSKPNRLFLEMLDHAYVYAFGQCKLKRLTGLVASDNLKALKLDKHIGFIEEGVMRQAGNQGQDIITLVMWPDNYYRGQKHGF